MQNTPVPAEFYLMLGELAVGSAIMVGSIHYGLTCYVEPAIEAFSDHYALPKGKRSKLWRAVRENIREANSDYLEMIRKAPKEIKSVFD